MAERRMLAKSIVLLGAFAELSHGAQALYVFLNMQADDDGFVGNYKPILRQSRCSRRHLQELLDGDLVLSLDTGPLVIRHWLIHNQIRKDRYKPTLFRREKEGLTRDGSGVYQLAPTGCQAVTPGETQERIGQSSLAQSSLVQSSLDQEREPVPPPAESMSSITDFEKTVFRLYQDCCSNLSECGYLCADTRKNIAILENNGWTEEALERAFTMANQTAFLCGYNDRGWCANLDWLCVDDNLRKLLDGKYFSYKKEPVPKGATGLGKAELEAIQKLLAQDEEGS